MKCFRLRCYVNNSFLVFHQGTKHSKTIKHSRFALVFHTVFSCLDLLMKHSNSLFTYNIHNHFTGRYSDTNVEKSAILLLKIEQNGGLLEILSHYIFARNACQGRSDSMGGGGVGGCETHQL